MTIERKDYRSTGELREALVWYRQQLEIARAGRLTAEETLDRVRIEVHQSLADQIQCVKAEIKRGEDELEAARSAGRFLLAGELSKIQAERRRRAAVLREIRGRVISAGLGMPKSDMARGGET